MFSIRKNCLKSPLIHQGEGGATWVVRNKEGSLRVSSTAARIILGIRSDSPKSYYLAHFALASDLALEFTLARVSTFLRKGHATSLSLAQETTRNLEVVSRLTRRMATNDAYPGRSQIEFATLQMAEFCLFANIPETAHGTTIAWDTVKQVASLTRPPWISNEMRQMVMGLLSRSGEQMVAIFTASKEPNLGEDESNDYCLLNARKVSLNFYRGLRM